MFYRNNLNNAKYLVLAMLVAFLVGCGGGRADTTSSNTQSDTLGVGNATLSWLPPTIYTDGAPITTLAGHNIYINDGSGFKLHSNIDNPGLTTYVVENLASGTYSFVVTAYDDNGIESSFSSETSITI